ncbi:MAG: ATP-binding protein [bacterium]|jgi:DNA repair exonuclease SbcCD ATPase subunit
MVVEQNIAYLQQGLEDLQAYYHHRRGQQEQLLQEQHRLEQLVTEVVKERELLDRVRVLLQMTSVHAREQARQTIESMVTRALQYAFGADLEFKIRLDEARGRPEAEFYVASTYGGERVVETRPQDARGGGVVDVISLALRLVLLQGTRPPLAGPLILDEPAKHVSEEFSLNVAQFLKEVAQVFHRQVIMVTHNQQLAGIADQAFRVELEEGRSEVKAVGE